MRCVVTGFLCLGLGATSLALADESTAAQDANATPPVTAAPSTPTAAPQAAAAAAAPAEARKPQDDPEEKRLIAMGWKPKIRNGVRVFCRREEELGTHLGAKEHCGTAADIKAANARSRDEAEEQRRQSLSANPFKG